MDINLFSELIPTWEILGFDENLSDIPCSSRDYTWDRDYNPLDKSIVIIFEPEENGPDIYYLPATEETRPSQNGYQYTVSQFKEEVNGRYRAEKLMTRCPRFIIHEEIIGESLVYRKFELTVLCEKDLKNGYICRTLPLKEVSRYVFCKVGLIIENPDKSRIITTVEKIMKDEAYDTICSLDGQAKYKLYRDFLYRVNVPAKENIIKSLLYVKKEYPKLGFGPFTEIFHKLTEKENIEDMVPKRIVNELYTRNHTTDKNAIRLEKDLVVVTGKRECRYLGYTEQIRAYFDSENAYFFKRNAVTGGWVTDDICNWLETNIWFECEWIIDRDIFDNTCMERYIGYSVDERFPRGNKVKMDTLLVQYGFLSAEQAAKIDRQLFKVIREGIYDGTISARDKTLPQVMGISGAQVKFLKNIKIPHYIDLFAEFVNEDDFIESFPDIQKRIFAVAFYLNGYSRGNSRWDLTKHEIFEAAQTLNSLEKIDEEKREIYAQEYKDYLIMHRQYENCMRNIDDDDPMMPEILSYGDMPVNMKPSKIKTYHDRIGQALDVMRYSSQINAYTAKIEERYENERASTEYTDGFYSILMPKDAREIIKEGRELKHCVARAGYIASMANYNCTILFLRDNHRIDVPLMTIEVRCGSIKQCYGYGNSRNEKTEITDFIMKYALIHNLRIEATI